MIKRNPDQNLRRNHTKKLSWRVFPARYYLNKSWSSFNSDPKPADIWAPAPHQKSLYIFKQLGFHFKKNDGILWTSNAKDSQNFPKSKRVEAVNIIVRTIIETNSETRSYASKALWTNIEGSHGLPSRTPLDSPTLEDLLLISEDAGTGIEKQWNLTFSSVSYLFTTHSL